MIQPMPEAEGLGSRLARWRNIRPDIFTFNDYGRDAWVAAQAARLPRGTRILDVGAGPCRYREVFAHCQKPVELIGPVAEIAPETIAMQRDFWAKR